MSMRMWSHAERRVKINVRFFSDVIDFTPHDNLALIEAEQV